jgi:hypothetical protein
MWPTSGTGDATPTVTFTAYMCNKPLLGGVLHFWKQRRKSTNIVRRYSEVNKIEKVACREKKNIPPTIPVTPLQTERKINVWKTKTKMEKPR